MTEPARPLTLPDREGARRWPAQGKWTYEDYRQLPPAPGGWTPR